MALKRKIDKASYDKLSDVLKSEYEEKDGQYILALDGDDGDEAAAALKRAKDREAQENREKGKKIKELEAQIDELTGNDAKKRGDIETLEKSWKDKTEKEKATYQAQIDKLRSVTIKTLVDGNAEALAAKISTVPSLMAKAIRERLTVDFEGDAPALRVLDGAGKLSAMTLEDLQKEFVANKDFSAIIVGSKASGSSASTNKQQGSGSANLNAEGKPKSFIEMSVSEKANYIKQQKEMTNQDKG